MKNDIANDRCEECEAGYYLTLEYNCQIFPEGIFGCIEYSNKEICDSCDAGLYLKDNECIVVETDDENCHLFN